MIHSKHHNQGMSFIELMGALALFAIFGSSLFIAQQYIFQRLIFNQYKVLAQIRMQEALTGYQREILQELFTNQGVVEKSLQEKLKKFTHPDMNIIITSTLTSGVKESDIDKNFGFEKLQNLYFITVKAENPDKKGSYYGTAYAFMYIPQVQK